MVIEVLLYLLVLATSLPVGLFLAWLCDDELIVDRKYFIMFTYFLLTLAIVLLIFYFKASLIFALIYLVFILMILVRKGRKLEMKKIKKKKY